MLPFIGRKSELQKIQALYDRKDSSIAVIKGRRRIGKSRLLTEFAKANKQGRLLCFTGLAPSSGSTAQIQRDHFGRQLAHQVGIPPLTFQDWTDAFLHLSRHVTKGDMIVFDEISWMGDKDETFIPKLKDWWDTALSLKTPVLLVFCGSVSTWIEDNILNSTAFFGRIALTITLEPLEIRESTELLRKLGFKGSPLEIYKLLSVVGGIPWYLERINPKMMADENIKQLCFQKDGVLVLEFDRIFHDLFGQKGTTYKNIIESLKSGMKTLAQVRKDIQFGKGGTLSKLLNNLIICGFLHKYAHWSLKTGKPSKQSLYKISDPYIRFYVKYIEPNRMKIDSGLFDTLALSQIPGIDAQLGFQVENLLLQSRSLLRKAMGLNASDIIFDGPYFQTKTERKRGCQIDYLVQTRTNNLFVCEFKFKRRELGPDILEEVQEKIRRFSTPRGFSVIPVLFHVSGVTEEVVEKNYFYRIVDIADFLEVANG